MSEKQKDVQREKPDAADAKNPDERYLPGQIPVEDSAGYAETGPAGQERQADPAEADQAVNPELQPKERKRA